jgi:hypothetical protein
MKERAVARKERFTASTASSGWDSRPIPSRREM